MTPSDDEPATPPRLQSVRFLTGLSMAFERLWPLLLPALIVLATLASLTWLGLFRSVEDTVRFTLVGLFGFAFVTSLWPLHRWRLPTIADINSRIETRNGLLHRPVTTQMDRPAGNAGELAQAFWREHQSRMARKLEGLQAASPNPKTHEHDRYALRALPALTLAVALAFSFGSLGGRVSDLWNGQAALPAVPPRIDAWVTPPRYTGKPPVFLASVEDGATITVPEGSELTVRIGAESKTEFSLFADGAPLLPVVAAAATPISKAPTSGQILAAKLSKNSTIALGTEAGTVKSWQFRIIDDLPPTIAFTADPGAASNGTVTLAYTVKDDYGATKGVAKFKLDPIKPDARPLYTMEDLALSLPRRNSADGAAKISKDLTQHPLAGEEFEITLEAEDGSGQKSVSAAKIYVMPEYYLASPLARAIAEDRRLLARDANAKPLVLELLDALTMRPEETINNASHFLGIETARIRLVQAKTDDELRAVADYLWQIALQIDKNSLSDAARRLQQAQDKLADALENGASDEEIDKLMQELRQAMNEYMKELAEDAKRNRSTAQDQQEGQELSSNDLEKMLDKLQDLAKQGSKEQAKELLNQLRDMMNNLQAKRGGKQGKGGEGQSEMEGKLNELGKMLRDQQQLMDETFRQDRDQFNPGEDGQPGEQGQGQQGEGQQGQGQQGQNGQGGQPGDKQGLGGLGDLEQRQNGLANRLQGMIDGLKGMGIEPGEELGDAGRAMGRAGKNLGQGDTSRAVGEQQQALDSLRRGAESLMEEMRQAMGEQPGGQQPGGKRGPNDKDPLGRPRATEGPDMGQSTKVPDEIDIQRAREILEAIRKRLGNALSPEVERNYLERLLKFD